MSDEIRTAIQETAQGPARVTVGEMTVEAQDIEKQIQADRYLGSQSAAARNHCGLRFVKLQPPGAG